MPRCVCSFTPLFGISIPLFLLRPPGRFAAPCFDMEQASDVELPGDVSESENQFSPPRSELSPPRAHVCSSAATPGLTQTHLEDDLGSVASGAAGEAVPENKLSASQSKTVQEAPQIETIVSRPAGNNLDFLGGAFFHLGRRLSGPSPCGEAPGAAQGDDEAGCC